MSWDLNVRIDLEDMEDALDLACAFVTGFGPSLEDIDCEEYGPYLRNDMPPLAKHWFAPTDDHRESFHELLTRLEDADRMLEIAAWFGVERDGEAFQRPVYLNIYGPRHAGNAGDGRRSDADLQFLNRMRFTGRAKTRSGEPVDEAYVARLLTHICERAQPRSLYVEAEQRASIPFNYHMVFHRTHTGFVDDLAEIARLYLWGGRGLTDSRRRYPPLHDIDLDHTMLFCYRSDEKSRELIDDLWYHQDVLEAVLGGFEVPEAPVYEAAMNAHTIEPMDTRRGLGVVAAPFLRRYCEPFYIDLLDRIHRALDADPVARHAAERAAMPVRAETLYRRADPDHRVSRGRAAVAAALGRSGPGRDAGADGATRAPFPDLVVEDRHGRLTPALIPPMHAESRPVVGPHSRLDAMARAIRTEVPEAARARVARYDVLVDDDARLPGGYKVVAEGEPAAGELWQAVDADARPPVWQRVEYDGRPVSVRRAGLRNRDTPETRAEP